MAFLRILLLIPLFSVSLFWLYYLIQNAPVTESQCIIKFTVPKTVKEITELNSCLKHYYNSNFMYILTLFSSVYIFKQAFCIPGSIILNIIAGSLFGTSIGFFLICLLSSIGVSVCYLLSQICRIETLIVNYFPSQLNSTRITLEDLIIFEWTGTLLINKTIYEYDKDNPSIYPDIHPVRKNKGQLWYLLIVLRVIPITPNWLLNLIAPIVKIPLWTLMYTTFFGLMPYNYICCQSGQTLSSINSLNEIFTLKTTLQLMSIAVTMVVIKIATKFCKINT